MTAYTVRLVVELDQPIDDTTARDLAARWAAALRLDPGLTSVDGTRLVLNASASWVDPQRLPARCVTALAELIDEALYTLDAWHAVEVLSADETDRRADVHDGRRDDLRRLTTE